MARAKLLIPPAKTLRMRMCMRAPSRTPRAHACAKREREGGGALARASPPRTQPSRWSCPVVA